MRNLSKEDRAWYVNLFERYVRETSHKNPEVIDVLKWAQHRGELELPRTALFDYHSERLSAALNMTRRTRSDGRSVRAFHCLKVISNGEPGRPVQRYLWSDALDMSKSAMEETLRQTREAIRVDIRSWETTRDYFNEILTDRGDRLIQMTFDYKEGDGGLAEAGA